jgi:hypothetical protein
MPRLGVIYRGTRVRRGCVSGNILSQVDNLVVAAGLIDARADRQSSVETNSNGAANAGGKDVFMICGANTPAAPRQIHPAMVPWGKPLREQLGWGTIRKELFFQLFFIIFEYGF